MAVELEGYKEGGWLKWPQLGTGRQRQGATVLRSHFCRPHSTTGWRDQTNSSSILAASPSPLTPTRTSFSHSHSGHACTSTCSPHTILGRTPRPNLHTGEVLSPCAHTLMHMPSLFSPGLHLPTRSLWARAHLLACTPTLGNRAHAAHLLACDPPALGNRAHAAHLLACIPPTRCLQAHTHLLACTPALGNRAHAAHLLACTPPHPQPTSSGTLCTSSCATMTRSRAPIWGAPTALSSTGGCRCWRAVCAQRAHQHPPPRAWHGAPLLERGRGAHGAGRCGVWWKGSYGQTWVLGFLGPRLTPSGMYVRATAPLIPVPPWSLCLLRTHILNPHDPGSCLQGGPFCCEPELYGGLQGQPRLGGCGQCAPVSILCAPGCV